MLPCPGVLAPVSLLATWWLAVLEEDWPHRHVLCGITIHARYTLGILHYFTLLYSFIFRTFLIAL